MTPVAASSTAVSPDSRSPAERTSLPGSVVALPAVWIAQSPATATSTPLLVARVARSVVSRIRVSDAQRVRCSSSQALSRSRR